jgi:hypothetical protein
MSDAIRDALAAIVDPRAFSSVGNTHLREVLGRGPRDRAGAFAKADQILAKFDITEKPRLTCIGLYCHAPKWCVTNKACHRVASTPTTEQRPEGKE